MFGVISHENIIECSYLTGLSRRTRPEEVQVVKEMS